ncbi:hypothetical protein HT031_003265 [Scenedesmus sp. PABB004]|nr:hypothetical protein HT031_003265 [Scenedesmus sp. PABB004]
MAEWFICCCGRVWRCRGAGANYGGHARCEDSRQRREFMRRWGMSPAVAAALAAGALEGGGVHARAALDAMQAQQAELQQVAEQQQLKQQLLAALHMAERFVLCCGRAWVRCGADANYDDHVANRCEDSRQRREFMRRWGMSPAVAAALAAGAPEGGGVYARTALDAMQAQQAELQQVA